MTGLCGADFMKLSVQELADLLSNKLYENISEDKDVAAIKLHGSVDGRLFEMDIFMKCVDE